MESFGPSRVGTVFHGSYTNSVLSLADTSSFHVWSRVAHRMDLITVDSGYDFDVIIIFLLIY